MIPVTIPGLPHHWLGDETKRTEEWYSMDPFETVARPQPSSDEEQNLKSSCALQVRLHIHP
jgi:hypothetical protein